MEAEIGKEIGAGLGEISAERVTHRNGYRPRLWETRVGEIELAVPPKRDGSSYFPSFLEPRRPCEQAIVACVMEAYVNGVSTRKVDRLVEQLGIHGMSKDRVSGCAVSSTSVSMRFATARSRASTRMSGSMPSTSRSETEAMSAAKRSCCLRGSRDRQA